MTVDRLAHALGVATRTLQRYLVRGLTVPQPGETSEQWVARAKAWRAANRGRPGPPASGGETKAEWDVRWRRARALTVELELQLRRGEVHGQAECEREQVARCQEIAAAFGNLGDVCARRLYQASPETIKLVIDEEVRRRLEILSGGG